MATLFTDPEAAIEEAVYLANDTLIAHCLVEVTPNGIQVMPKKEAMLIEGIVLETINPIDSFSIYD